MTATDSDDAYLHRNRGWYLLAGVVIVSLGLASRRYPQFVPDIFDKYPGDALWTMLVFVLWGVARPRASTLVVTLLALGTSYFVEFAQLYREPWIVKIRDTTLGHLVLGSTFAWGDVVAYTAGAVLAFTIERVVTTCGSELHRASS